MADELEALLARVEAATGPDRGLDGRIAWALGWRFNGFIWKGDPAGGPGTITDFDGWPYTAGSWKKPGDPSFSGGGDLSNRERHDGELSGRWTEPPLWTADLNAIVGLIERELPGWGWELTHPTDGGYGSVRIWNRGVTTTLFAKGATDALALCAAFLRAKLAQPQ